MPYIRRCQRYEGLRHAPRLRLLRHALPAAISVDKISARDIRAHACYTTSRPSTSTRYMTVAYCYFSAFSPFIVSRRLRRFFGLRLLFHYLLLKSFSCFLLMLLLFFFASLRCYFRLITLICHTFRALPAFVARFDMLLICYVY